MRTTRRALLSSLAAGTVAVTGCSTFVGSPTPDEPPTPLVDETPDPENNVRGANGEWSSFGCNAANTRTVGDDTTPVDGVSERWRVSVAASARREPVVAGGRVFLLDPDELRVLDASDGEELWTGPEVRAVPLVRTGVAYVSTGDAIRALDAETGEQLWERSPDVSGRVTPPATRAGDELICGVGERVLSLDPASGDVRWHRDVFGGLVGHPALLSEGSVVTTHAGLVYVLGEEGYGIWRVQLPAPPATPPCADQDRVYVACKNGSTYALYDREATANDVHWEAESVWAEQALAVTENLVLAVGIDELLAFDPDTGERYWRTGLGDSGYTAPAYGRDTVFVGGDRLHAFDPTPGDRPEAGPALRFEREFAGRVGPGPVIDDGTLYVVAEVATDEYALLALE